MAIVAANAAIRFAAIDGSPAANGLTRDTAVDHPEEAVDRLNAQTGGHGLIMVDRGIFDWNVASAINTNNVKVIGTGQGNGTTDHAVLRAISDITIFDFSSYGDWQHGFGLHNMVLSGNNVAARSNPLVSCMRPGFGFTMDDLYFRDIPVGSTAFDLEIRNGANNAILGNLEFASFGGGHLLLRTEGAPGVAYGYHVFIRAFQLDSGGQIPVLIDIDGSSAGGFKNTFDLGHLETENTTVGHANPVVLLEGAGSAYGSVTIHSISQSTDADSGGTKVLVKDTHGRFRVDLPAPCYGQTGIGKVYESTIGVGEWPFRLCPGRAIFGMPSFGASRAFDFGDGTTVPFDIVCYQIVGPGVSYWVGAGSPEGVVPGLKGSDYTRSDGGAGTTRYAKTSSSGKSDKLGWTAYA